MTSAYSYNGVSVFGFLGSQFGAGAIVFGEQSVDVYRDSFGKDGQTGTHGYNGRIDSNEIATYHILSTNLPVGTYYWRPVLIWNGIESLGIEQILIVQ